MNTHMPGFRSFFRFFFCISLYCKISNQQHKGLGNLKNKIKGKLSPQCNCKAFPTLYVLCNPVLLLNHKLYFLLWQVSHWTNRGCLFELNL